MLSNSTIPSQLHSTHLYSTRGYSINLKVTLPIPKITFSPGQALLYHHNFTRYYSPLLHTCIIHLYSSRPYCIKLHATRPELSSTQLNPYLKHSFISLSITSTALDPLTLLSSTQFGPSLKDLFIALSTGLDSPPQISTLLY